ncbi:MAG: N(4)-(beta-N-acetylglucosaminyl)-L-asparaginase [Armatimonadetes bacterium]|nr:N(4)-(beta-N-acetylglucosaminyl)-L-asparaginase [Armatimonadota bacterium]
MSSPVVIATWTFGRLACEAARPVLAEGGVALDAVEAGATAVELDESVTSVGWGGLPNAAGEMELDAVIMDGRTHDAGAVAALQGFRTPTRVARCVMERTRHTMLVGANARSFALSQGFQEEPMLSSGAQRRWEEWRREQREPEGHDTVGVCALDARGNLAGVCTTSGLAWKLPGRVGDTPIIGSGLYVDNDIGVAAATGNGDEIMKCCLSARVVWLMSIGRTAQTACEEAIAYLLRKRPNANGMEAACVAIAKDGATGSAATQAGFDTQQWMYAVWRGSDIEVREGVYVPYP